MNEKATDKVRKQSLVRTWFQAAWFVLTNSYIRGYAKGMIFTGNTKVICFPGLNCYSCPGALASCPMGSLQAVMGDSSFRFSLYVFGMISAMGALFGRLICGWMCPFGFFQDLLHKIPIKIKKKNLPGHKYLKYLKYVILVVFPILLVSLVTDITGTSSPFFCEWICPSGMLFGGIPLVAVNASLRAAAGLHFAWKLFILIVITLVGIVYYRPFCKYLCPLGALYSLFNPISTYRLSIDTEKCVKCGSCRNACGMDISTFETPNSLECIRCGSCMKACPTGAISSTWGQAAQKIKKRCFVDDDEMPAASAASDSLTKRTTFFGILTVATGLITMYGVLFAGLILNMLGFLTIDLYYEMNSMYLVTFFLWSIAAIILVISGIYAIVHRKDPEAISSLAEKARAALYLDLAGIPFIIIGIAKDPGTLMAFLQPSIFSLSFFFGVPIALALAKILSKCARSEQGGEESKNKHRISWALLSFLYIINLTFLPIIMAALNLSQK